MNVGALSASLPASRRSGRELRSLAYFHTLTRLQTRLTARVLAKSCRHQFHHHHDGTPAWSWSTLVTTETNYRMYYRPTQDARTHTLRICSHRRRLQLFLLNPPVLLQCHDKKQGTTNRKYHVGGQRQPHLPTLLLADVTRTTTPVAFPFVLAFQLLPAERINCVQTYFFSNGYLYT